MLQVSNLNTFYGGAHILHDVSLAVKAGEVVALLGRNGAGKSTTIKSIIGLAPPRSGKIQFEGRSIFGLPAHVISRAGIGYVPEERRIFPSLTVNENLEVGIRAPQDGAPKWTHDQLFELFPNLAERRRNLGKQLSGGEQQMLAIARTLMGNPKLVLLDEPSEGIAPVIVEQLASTLQVLKLKGLAVLLSEQNLHFAHAVSDRAMIIEKGAIRYEGSLAELDAHPDISAQYLAV
jgi:branched-chain amino acid transport system ATP-binding protein